MGGGVPAGQCGISVDVFAVGLEVRFHDLSNLSCAYHIMRLERGLASLPVVGRMGVALTTVA